MNSDLPRETKASWTVPSYFSITFEYIHVNHIVNHFVVKLCEAIPGLHAFTGCDYTPAFSGRGKTKTLKNTKESIEVQEAFVSYRGRRAGQRGAVRI